MAGGLVAGGLVARPAIESGGSVSTTVSAAVSGAVNRGRDGHGVGDRRRHRRHDDHRRERRRLWRHLGRNGSACDGQRASGPAGSPAPSSREVATSSAASREASTPAPPAASWSRRWGPSPSESGSSANRFQSTTPRPARRRIAAITPTIASCERRHDCGSSNADLVVVVDDLPPRTGRLESLEDLGGLIRCGMQQRGVQVLVAAAGTATLAIARDGRRRFGHLRRWRRWWNGRGRRRWRRGWRRSRLLDDPRQPALCRRARRASSVVVEKGSTMAAVVHRSPRTEPSEATSAPPTAATHGRLPGRSTRRRSSTRRCGPGSETPPARCTRLHTPPNLRRAGRRGSRRGWSWACLGVVLVRRSTLAQARLCSLSPSSSCRAIPSDSRRSRRRPPPAQERRGDRERSPDTAAPPSGEHRERYLVRVRRAGAGGGQRRTRDRARHTRRGEVGLGSTATPRT